MQLSPAELKVYLVVTHAIQRDGNKGLLSVSQVAKRADLSERHARKAIDALCRSRLLIRVNRVTGAELTRKEEWNGRTVKYANPIQWKQKDTSNLGPTGQGSEPEDDDRNALRNDATESKPLNPGLAPVGEGDLRPVGQGYLRPVGQRHSEYSEYLEGADIKHAQPQVEPSAFLGLSLERSDCDKRITGFASAKGAEGSPGAHDVVAETARTQNQKAEALAKPASVEEENPSMKAKSQTPTAYDATDDEREQIEDVLSCFEPAELEEWDGSGVPDWVPDAAFNAAPGVSQEAVCAFLRRKAAAGWQPAKWTAIPAIVRDAFTPKQPKAKHAKPWTPLDLTSMEKWLSAFMEGEAPPANLVSWITDFAAEYDLEASDIHDALQAAWNRRAAPGEKNAPQSWNWFYEVLRAAFIPGYASRLPEAPAKPSPAHQVSVDQMQRGMEALEPANADNSLVSSFLCRCGAEIRQYQNRVVGTCTCGGAKPITRAGVPQMPTQGNGKRRTGGVLP